MGKKHRRGFQSARIAGDLRHPAHQPGAVDLSRSGCSTPEIRARTGEPSKSAFFGWDDIPWDEVAFPSVRWALHHEREARLSGDFTTRTAPATDYRVTSVRE